MAKNNAFEINPSEPAIRFMLSFNISCANYVASRILLKTDLLIPGCLLGQQFAEICCKAILRIHWQELQEKHQNDSEKVIRKYNHDIGKLLKDEEGLVKGFADITSDSELMAFLNDLSDVYSSGRFGEKTVGGNTTEIINLLDQIARKLLEIHAKAIKHSTFPKLYVKDSIKEIFLEGNKVFKEKDITTNILASMIPLLEK